MPNGSVWPNTTDMQVYNSTFCTSTCMDSWLSWTWHSRGDRQLAVLPSCAKSNITTSCSSANLLFCCCWHLPLWERLFSDAWRSMRILWQTVLASLSSWWKWGACQAMQEKQQTSWRLEKKWRHRMRCVLGPCAFKTYRSRKEVRTTIRLWPLLLYHMH